MFKHTNKRENRAYGSQVDYAKKRNIGKHFMDYLSPSKFNKMSFHLKNISFSQCLIKSLNV